MELQSGSTAQIVYISHGGGPLPLLQDSSHKAMINFMQKLPSQLKTPDYILVISAHWEESVITLQGAEQPSMYYDYSGFPPQTYSIKYPAPGCPEQANTIAELLKKNGINATIDNKRGFDHGLFIPLLMMYPEAKIPSLQISLCNTLNPQEHLSVGESLQSLKNSNMLIIGSGFSFHNLYAFSLQENSTPDHKNDTFQNWLIETCAGSLPWKERINRLVHWEQAPHARYCHPREEHLLPLHVCMGIAGKAGQVIFDGYILGKRSVAFLWE